MNLQEYINKHGNVEVNEKVLNDLLGIKEPKVWKPQEDDTYYYITSSGDIYNDTWLNNNCCDKVCYAMGNCFKTKEEAEFAIERLKVIATMKRYAQEHNDYDVDWLDNQDKYFISYDFGHERIVYCSNRELKHNSIYFTLYEIAENCVKEIGEERIKKYYLQVED